MSKLISVYIVAGLILFGALFAVFAIAGIGRPAVVAPEVSLDETTAGPQEAAYPPLEFVPPDLEPERVYRISHDTPIYEEPDVAGGRRETLPAGGYFTAVYTLSDTPGPWTQITVNDGFRDYSMYLLGTDLKWKVVTPVLSGDEQRDQEMAALMERLQAVGERRSAQRALETTEEPEIQEAPTFAEWWADRAERMGGATVANLVVAGFASAVLTIVIVGAIVVLTMLRREHEWARPVTPHDDAIDLQPEDEDPFTYSAGGNAYAANDDEDPRRA